MRRPVPCAAKPPKRPAGLTPRETEVLRLIAAGHTAKQAAHKLEIAPKTADNHIQSLYSKIGVTTRAAAALYALERRPRSARNFRRIGNPPHVRPGLLPVSCRPS